MRTFTIEFIPGVKKVLSSTEEEEVPTSGSSSVSPPIKTKDPDSSECPSSHPIISPILPTSQPSSCKISDGPHSLPLYDSSSTPQNHSFGTENTDLETEFISEEEFFKEIEREEMRHSVNMKRSFDSMFSDSIPEMHENVIPVKRKIDPDAVETLEEYLEQTAQQCLKSFRWGDQIFL